MVVVCRSMDGDLEGSPWSTTHTHTNPTPHPPTTCTLPWGERPAPDLLQQGGQREFNMRVPHSSKVIIAVAAGRGPSGTG